MLRGIGGADAGAAVPAVAAQPDRLRRRPAVHASAAPLLGHHRPRRRVRGEHVPQHVAADRQPGAVLRSHRPLGRAGADDVGQRHGGVAGAARAVVVAVGGAGREDERAVGPRRAVLHRAQHRAAPRQLRAQRRQRRRRQGGAGVPASDHRPDHGLVAVVLFEPVRHPRARDGHVGPAGVVELHRSGDDVQRDPERARLFELARAVQQDLRADDRRARRRARRSSTGCSRTTTACARATSGCRRPTSSASTITSRASPSCSAS